MLPKTMQDFPVNVIKSASTNESDLKLCFSITNQSCGKPPNNENEVRSKLLSFLIIPLKVSFAICLSPFYLKVQEKVGHDKASVLVKCCFPKKLFVLLWQF